MFMVFIPVSPPLPYPNPHGFTCFRKREIYLSDSLAIRFRLLLNVSVSSRIWPRDVRNLPTSSRRELGLRQKAESDSLCDSSREVCRIIARGRGQQPVRNYRFASRSDMRLFRWPVRITTIFPSVASRAALASSKWFRRSNFSPIALLLQEPQLRGLCPIL